jgi:hypothetical protein
MPEKVRPEQIAEKHVEVLQVATTPPRFTADKVDRVAEGTV